MSTVDNNITDEYICINCNKKYKHITGLLRHNRKYHIQPVCINESKCIQNDNSSTQNVNIICKRTNSSYPLDKYTSRKWMGGVRIIYPTI